MTPQKREAANRKRREARASKVALEQAQPIALATGAPVDASLLASTAASASARGVPVDICFPLSSMQSAVDDDITQHTGDFDDEFDAELKKLDSLIAKSRAIIDSKQQELKVSSNSRFQAFLQEQKVH